MGPPRKELAFVGEGQQRAAQPPSALADAQSRADALVARKEYDQAAAIYDGLIASQPQSMPPRYLRVAVLAQAGRSADVESGLLAARKALPATPEARLEAGAHLEELARKGTSLPPADRTRLFAEAVILFDEALAMRADLADAMAYKSIALRGQSRLESNAAEASRLMAEAERMTAAAQAARKP